MLNQPIRTFFGSGFMKIKKIAKAYGVYYAKVQEGDGNADDYLMDHTAITFLMGPDGKYVTHFGHDIEADAMAERLSGILSASGS